MVKVKKDNKTHLIHFGGKYYKDYTTYYKINPVEAEKHKQNYLKRHKTNENWNDILSPGFWAVNILWNKPTISEALRETIKKYNIELEPF